MNVEDGQRWKVSEEELQWLSSTRDTGQPRSKGRAVGKWAGRQAVFGGKEREVACEMVPTGRTTTTHSGSSPQTRQSDRYPPAYSDAAPPPVGCVTGIMEPRYQEHLNTGNGRHMPNSHGG